jgi:hypothetical protein
MRGDRRENFHCRSPVFANCESPGTTRGFIWTAKIGRDKGARKNCDNGEAIGPGHFATKSLKNNLDLGRSDVLQI